MSLSRLEIILVEPIYPGNVGAIARSAANFGVETIKIIGELDISCDDAKQMSLYGYPLLQKATRWKSLSEAVADCNLVIGTVQQERYNRSIPLPTRTMAETYRSRFLSEKSALVFGREDNGLTREEIDQCHILSTILTPTGLSFNLAHSVTVFLSEIYQAIKDIKPFEENNTPTQSELNDLIDLMQSSLYGVGFFKSDQSVNALIRIRDIVYRMNLETSDWPVLKAVFYKVDSFVRRALPLLPKDAFKDCQIREKPGQDSSKQSSRTL